MDIDTLNGLIHNPAELIAQVEKYLKPYYEREAALEYDPHYHKIKTDFSSRPNKWVETSEDIFDEQGFHVMDAISQRPLKRINKTQKDRIRIPLPIQRYIVKVSAAFAAGGKIDFKTTAKSDVELLLYKLAIDTWKQNKLQFKVKKLLKYMMSQLESAMLWYSVPPKSDGDPETLRMKILAPSLGDEMGPIFDSYGDMSGFVRMYKTSEGTHHDVYTDTLIIEHITDNSGVLTQNKPIEHKFGKIPVIYFFQTKAQWADVQALIERLETLGSDHAEINAKNAEPILAISGKVESTDNAERTVQLENGADVKYVTWDNAPQSVKLERENLLEDIFTYSQTPKLSLSQLIGLHSISGVALDRILINSHLNAKDIQDDTWGEGIQRCLNFLISAQKGLNPQYKDVEIEIEPIFNIFKLDDMAEKITNAKLANGGLPVVDHVASIEMAGLTEDAKATYEKILAETPVAPTVINPTVNDRIKIDQ